MTSTLIALIGFYSALYGIDPVVALSVANVESGMRVDARGSHGEVGIFQLMPSTYPQYSVKQLLNPELNINLGVKYLAWNKANCKHKDNINFLVCWNYGIKNAEHVKHPSLFPYVRKVAAEMRKHPRPKPTFPYPKLVNKPVKKKKERAVHLVAREEDIYAQQQN